MKKVLIIKGAHRKNGNTSFLLDNFCRGLKEADKNIQIEIADLTEKKVEFCRGCSDCSNEENIKLPIGKCPIEDDVRELIEKSLSCDILIYASPIYELGPTALIKRFMERNLPIVGKGKMGVKPRHSKRSGKIGVIFLNSGAPYPINVIFGFTKYPSKLFSWFLDFYGCSKKFKFTAGGLDISEKMKKNWGSKAFALGKKTTLA